MAGGFGWRFANDDKDDEELEAAPIEAEAKEEDALPVAVPAAPLPPWTLHKQVNDSAHVFVPPERFAVPELFIPTLQKFIASRADAVTKIGGKRGEVRVFRRARILLRAISCAFWEWGWWRLTFGDRGRYGLRRAGPPRRRAQQSVG